MNTRTTRETGLRNAATDDPQIAAADIATLGRDAADRAPRALGVNVTVNVNELPLAKVVPDPGKPVVTKFGAFAPVTATDLKVTVDELLFVTVNDWPAGVPLTTDPKSFDVGEGVIELVATALEAIDSPAFPPVSFTAVTM